VLSLEFFPHVDQWGLSYIQSEEIKLVGELRDLN
jgi:hypothetical protein